MKDNDKLGLDFQNPQLRLHFQKSSAPNKATKQSGQIFKSGQHPAAPTENSDRKEKNIVTSLLQGALICTLFGERDVLEKLSLGTSIYLLIHWFLSAIYLNGCALQSARKCHAIHTSPLMDYYIRTGGD